LAHLPRPYQNETQDFMYNLLFCDAPDIFRSEAEKDWAGSALFADPPDYNDVAKVAQNPNEESRIRALACNMLRANGKPVPSRLLLGVVLEIAMQEGLDALAAYGDMRVRYISRSGKLAIFERQPAPVAEKARQLVDVASLAVQKARAWTTPRLPAPRVPNARITWLTTDGPYIAEAHFAALVNDSSIGPVLRKGRELLDQIVIAAKQKQ
jgi:hypothetical protein